MSSSRFPALRIFMLDSCSYATTRGWDIGIRRRLRRRYARMDSRKNKEGPRRRHAQPRRDSPQRSGPNPFISEGYTVDDAVVGIGLFAEEDVRLS
jgi:hypothetical protein